jgi:hypothetical protein
LYTVSADLTISHWAFPGLTLTCHTKPMLPSQALRSGSLFRNWFLLPEAEKAPKPEVACAFRRPFIRPQKARGAVKQKWRKRRQSDVHLPRRSQNRTYLLYNFGFVSPDLFNRVFGSFSTRK